jgi:hypothetical protein
VETVGQNGCETWRFAGRFWAVCTTTAPHPATSYRRDGAPQQDAAAAADPFHRANVDHLVKPEQFTIEHPMMKPEADNAVATVPKP